MPIKSKVFIQTLKKSQDSHKMSVAFEFNEKTPKKSLGQICPPPPPIQLRWIYPPIQLGLRYIDKKKSGRIYNQNCSFSGSLTGRISGIRLYNGAGYPANLLPGPCLPSANSLHIIQCKFGRKNAENINPGRAKNLSSLYTVLHCAVIGW